MSYIPPYTISEKAVSLVAEIAAALERYKIVMEGPDGVRLRKINHIRTVRGTTAIEGNTLTEEQVTALLGHWNELFFAAPIENIVFNNQAEYYRAIENSTARADSGPFVDFMLERILETIKEKSVLINVPINVPINSSVLDLVLKNPGIKRVRMAELLSVDVKTIGRSLKALEGKVEYRGSKKTGGYYVVEER